MPLYKFLPPDPDIVIGNRKLRFTRPSGLNDPFELSPYFESVASEQEIADKFWAKFNIGDAFDTAYDKSPEGEKRGLTREQFFAVVHKKLSEDKVDVEGTIQGLLDSFFTMLPKLTELARVELKKHLQRVGILSLSTDPTNQHMWMHYAKAHTGFAIEFDEGNPFFNQRRSDKDEFYHLRKVDYYDELPAYRSITEMDGATIFCSKGSHCILEKEWRMLVPLPEVTATSTIEEELFDFPEHALTAVIFGLSADPKFKEKVVAHLNANPKYSHVKVQEITMLHKQGKLAIAPI